MPVIVVDTLEKYAEQADFLKAGPMKPSSSSAKVTELLKQLTI